MPSPLSERFARADDADCDSCALCGKKAREVKRMVAAETGSHICEECVYGAALLLAADGWQPPSVKIKVAQGFQKAIDALVAIAGHTLPDRACGDAGDWQMAHAAVVDMAMDGIAKAGVR